MTKPVLKITLVTIAVFAAVLTAGAQDQRLNLSGTRMSVSNILLQIREQTHLGVAYRTDQIDTERMVTLPSREISLGEVVGIITRGTGIKGEIDGKILVFIKENPAPVPATDVFRPTPLSEFRESLGLRPRSVVLGNDPSPREELVEIALPQESYKFPTSNYTFGLSALPRFAFKTNVPYWFVGGVTPNISFETALGRNGKTTLEVGGSYNWLKLKGSLESNKKLVHMIIKPEFRYWLCERFDGHFFGAHALYTRYNIGTHQVPLLFDKEYRYDGYGIGAGVTYGYHWAITRGFGLEFAVGAGVVYLDYDRFDCAACNRDSEPKTKTYFGPTNAAINLVFLIK